MNPQHANNFEELRTRFDGKEAIYVEQGVLRVRVNDIRSQGGFHIRANAEEIPTPGLGVGRFHRPRPTSSAPRRWRIGAGYLTSFTTQSWQAGYGGWSLYFASEIIQAVIEFAARLPEHADPRESYAEVGRLLMNLNSHEPSQLVFPDAVEPGSGKLRRSDLPAVLVQISSGWVACPCCDMRFMTSDPRRWDGEKHTTCGQKLILDTA